MAAPNTEIVVVMDKDVEQQRLSFDEGSNTDNDQLVEYDPQPALQREIWGWYAYSWAVDGWTAASASVFMPLIISTMAYTGGRNVVDPAKPCNLAQPCMVKLGTSEVTPSSYTLYVTAIAILIQAIIYIQLGAVADHSGEFSYYLPKLARNTPSVRDEKDPVERAKKLTLQTSNISLSGFTAGYVGGMIQMGLSIGESQMSQSCVLYAMGSSFKGLIIGCAIGGIWWSLFTIIPHIFVTRRRGPLLPKGENYFTYPWKRLGKTMRRISHLSHLFQYLLMWLFLSDGLYTILKVAVLFAQTVVRASSLVILTGSLLTMAVGGPSTVLWKWIERRYSIRPKIMLIILSLLICFIPLYSLVGLSPNVAGGTLAYARSTFAEIVPIGRENEMYSMFLITQGGGGWIGPLITGVITDKTGNMRYCDLVILVFILVAVIWLYFINIEEAKKQAVAAAKFEAEEFGIKQIKDDQSS
ncbi:hypothetical protein INT43_005811 [Umbelopsis isabellina]|uniref:Autophagy-related protein n=1 Tax=Mortierella isabellina TaxID=91625 RepID=A0A8H7PIU2_MORIS|nr:hypothetical protein INT43_005811 [Umbelopsis isabellina]